MQIRILSFPGCPNVEPTVRLVGEVLAELGVTAVPEHVEIGDRSEAAGTHFLGSPSVQIDGEDMEAGRAGDAPFFGCRLYSHGLKRSGIPPRGMIVEAIERARRRVT